VAKLTVTARSGRTRLRGQLCWTAWAAFAVLLLGLAASRLSLIAFFSTPARRRFDKHFPESAIKDEAVIWCEMPAECQFNTSHLTMMRRNCY
jgi:hypothetical protein